MSSRHLIGSLVYSNQLEKTDAGDITAADLVNVGLILVNKTSGEATGITLPEPAFTSNSQAFIIVDAKGDAGSNNITITPSSGTINGAATYVINVNYGAVQLVHDGTNWTSMANTQGSGSLDLSAVAQHYVVSSGGTYDIASGSATIRNLYVDTIATGTAAADEDGPDLTIQGSAGGAHTSNDPDGGDVVVVLGDAGSGGSGSEGVFEVNSGGTPGTNGLQFIHDGSGKFTIQTTTNDLYVSNDHGTTLRIESTGVFQFEQANGNDVAEIRTGQGIKLVSGSYFGWTGSATEAASSADTIIERPAAGVVGIGDGTDGLFTIGKSDQQQTAANDAAGSSLYVTVENGGTDGGTASQGQDGGSLVLQAGNGSDAVTTDADGGDGGDILLNPGTRGALDGGGANGDTGGVFIKPVAAEPTPPTNYAGIYVTDGGTAELYTVDEAGNETLQTPHAVDAPAAIYDETPGIECVQKQQNRYMDRIVWLNETRRDKYLEMQIDGQSVVGLPKFRIVETIDDYNARTGKNVVKMDWAEVQAKHQIKYDRIRAEQLKAREQWDAERQAEIDAKDEWDGLDDKAKATTPEPSVRPMEERPRVREAKDIRKPVPPQLRKRQ